MEQTLRLDIAYAVHDLLTVLAHNAVNIRRHSNRLSPSLNQVYRIRPIELKRTMCCLEHVDERHTC
jgi:hypothetical protein